MERCYDLLEPKAKEIMALDDKDGNMQLKGLSWVIGFCLLIIECVCWNSSCCLLLSVDCSKVPVRSMEEFEELYSIGVQRRKVAHTGLNDVSSRSHAVLSLRVNADVVKGKLNFIDLAGTSLGIEPHAHMCLSFTLLVYHLILCLVVMRRKRGQ